nr:unnamed protein product [Callosobruchus analis]
MEIFLRILSDPGFQIGVGKDEGIHRTTLLKHKESGVLSYSGYGISRWLMTPYRNPEIREIPTPGEERASPKGAWPTEEKVSNFAIYVPVDEQEDGINEGEEEHNSENADENVRRRGTSKEGRN